MADQIPNQLMLTIVQQHHQVDVHHQGTLIPIIDHIDIAIITVIVIRYFEEFASCLSLFVSVPIYHMAVAVAVVHGTWI
jgi:hypothetical protein